MQALELEEKKKDALETFTLEYKRKRLKNQLLFGALVTAAFVAFQALSANFPSRDESSTK